MRKFRSVFAICFVMLMCIMFSCGGCPEDECKCTGFCFKCSCDGEDCSCTENLPNEFAKTSWFLQDNNASSRYSYVTLDVKASNMRLIYALASSRLTKSIEELNDFVFQFEYKFEPETGAFQNIEQNAYGIYGNVIDNNSLTINLPTGDKVTLTKK